MINDNKIMVCLDESGKEKEYEVILTFDSNETNKSYIVFTENKYDKNKNLIVYARSYDKEDKTFKLNIIDDEKEWNFLNDLLHSMEESK